MTNLLAALAPAKIGDSSERWLKALNFLWKKTSILMKSAEASVLKGQSFLHVCRNDCVEMNESPDQATSHSPVSQSAPLWYLFQNEFRKKWTLLNYILYSSKRWTLTVNIFRNLKNGVLFLLWQHLIDKRRTASKLLLSTRNVLLHLFHW